MKPRVYVKIVEASTEAKRIGMRIISTMKPSSTLTPQETWI